MRSKGGVAAGVASVGIAVAAFGMCRCGGAPASSPSALPAPSATLSSSAVDAAPPAVVVRASMPDAGASCAASADAGELLSGAGAIERESCVASAKGACAHGTRACADGVTSCRPAPATPEVFDGIDNDCNGAVDDVSPADVRPRALVLGPPPVWSDAKAAVDDVVAALEQAGVSFDVQPPKTGWQTLVPALRNYALVVIPGYVEAGAIPATMLAALEAFASDGGVVVVMKPIVNLARPDTSKLSGLTATVRQPKTTSIRIEGSAAPLAAIDSPEERTLPLVLGVPQRALDVWVLTPDPAAHTEVLARAFAGDTPLGAVATRRPVGRGAVYSWGYNLTDFDGDRCYVNCFEPAGDVQRLFLRDALREGSAGHVILKHSVPGVEEAALLLSHDLDSADAFNAGEWGAPGALRMASME